MLSFICSKLLSLQSVSVVSGPGQISSIGICFVWQDPQDEAIWMSMHAHPLHDITSMFMRSKTRFLSNKDKLADVQFNVQR